MRNNMDLEKIYQDIFRKKKKIIGWGASGTFKYFDTLYPIQLDYLVDKDPQKWNKHYDGVQIFEPSVIKNEDPDNVLIIIYSSFSSEIENEIREFGNYLNISASIIFNYKESITTWRRINEVILSDRGTKRKPKSQQGIIIQGPIIEDVTVEVVKYYSVLYPDDYIIVSTWDDSDPNLIHEIRKYSDEYILNKKPIYKGVQNRNLQFYSTVQALKLAKELKLKRILKTRTDLLILSKDILNLCEFVRNQYETFVCNQYGIENRFIIPESFTRKYLLYHPSDLCMYGNLNDLELYWDVPFDDRNYSLMDEDWKEKTLLEISKAQASPEVYLGVEFCKKINREMHWTVFDSWKFYKEFFITMDNHWFDLYWYKNPIFPDFNTSNKTRENINHVFWQMLYFNSLNSIGELNRIDINRIKWKEFVSNPF